MNTIGPDTWPCPECGGDRVKGDVTGAMVAPPGNSPIFSGVGFTALVCTACGYTSLYVIDPPSFARSTE